MDRDCGGLRRVGLLVYVGTAAYVSFFVEDAVRATQQQ